jgi:putative SOS response-associated peptidase YedK
VCGRMTITLTIEQAAAALPGVRLIKWFGPRYNVAPTQTVPVVRNDQPTDVHWLRWDLRPIGQGAPLINARAETLAEKSTFRNAFACASAAWSWLWILRVAPVGRTPGMRALLFSIAR